MNKTSVIVVCFITLCIAQKAQCDLMLLEPVGGQKLTYDDATGNYWIWDTTMFTSMTYQEQMTGISALGSYGGLTGWHMATEEEYFLLRGLNGMPTMAQFFAPNYSENGWAGWGGRVDSPWLPEDIPDTHREFIFSMFSIDEAYVIDSLDAVSGPAYDYDSNSYLGAWVVTPVPPAVLLCMLGLGVAGVKLRKYA